MHSDNGVSNVSVLALLGGATHAGFIRFTVDPVYMHNDAWKKEYVLNEDGMQFYGSHLGIGWMDWYFGQVP